MKTTLCAFLVIMLCGCGLLGGNRASGEPSPSPMPALSPSPAPAPTPTPTPVPTPSPVPVPLRYEPGETVGGTVLEVQRISDEASAFILQTFWMEAMVVSVSNASITDDAGGSYKLVPGARVVMRFETGVPDEPPFSAIAGEVRIVDYISDTNGIDPHFVALNNFFGAETELYGGIKRVAVDLSGAKQAVGEFPALAKEFCDNRGYELILSSEAELKAQGVMAADGFIDGGVYFAFSDPGEKKGLLTITAERRVAQKSRVLHYTLIKKIGNNEAKWFISLVK